jgi:CRISPR-associated protein, Cas2 family
MVVIIMERVPISARGLLSRWMIEPHPGVFVGHVSARVRDLLWDQCSLALEEGGIIQLYTTNNEQRFSVRVFGSPRRAVVDCEGLLLIRRKANVKQN